MLGKKSSTDKIDSLVGKKSTVEGSLNFSGGLHVDGIVRGDITALENERSTLSVSQHGKVEGNIRVPYVSLNGTIVGDVHAAERVVLLANARVTGDVHYTLLEMALGAQVNGRLVRLDEAPRKAPPGHPLRPAVADAGKATRR